MREQQERSRVHHIHEVNLYPRFTTPTGIAVIGVVLTLLESALGGGCSVRIPSTEHNVALAAALGAKDKTRGTIPHYLRERIAANYDLFNNTTTLTVGQAEGVLTVVLGRQPEVPTYDISLSLAKP